MTIAPSFVTPLRYPGGKGRLGAWLGKVIKDNDMAGGRYVEPYAGGAGAAVFLLANNMVEEIVINDLDLAIYSFWWAVFNDTDSLVRLISETPVNMDSWFEQKEIVSRPSGCDPTVLGFAAFYLNRTNRSGIIQGGVIGGKDQKGKYLIDARYNKLGLISRVERLAALRGRVKLHNLDALELISLPEYRGEGNLIYLDPPYFNKGSQLYRNHYNPEDHAEIAKAVMELDAPWIVTYDNCPEIRDLYVSAEKYEFSFHYSTHIKRPVAKEIMFHGNLKRHAPPTMRR